MSRVFVRVLLPLAVMVASAPVSAFDGCRLADVNGDGVVGTADSDLLDVVLGLPDPRRDLDGNGTVGKEDFAILLSFFGVGCAKSCPADLDRDRDVDEQDRSLLEADFGLDCRPDLDRDGFVDGDSLLPAAGGGGDADADVLSVYLNAPAAPSSAEARADFVNDQYVDAADQAVLGAAVPRDCRSDLNSDGEVDMTDVWALLASWGPCS